LLDLSDFALSLNKLKKTITISLIIIASTLVLVIAFISPLSKYLVEKYDTKYTGREITLDWAYVNPFTGFVHLHNVNIFEQDQDTTFFSSASISANFALLKLFSSTYEISELTLDQPRGLIFQNKSHFNFSDLIEKFSSKEKTGKKKDPLHLNILNITVLNGLFFYREIVTPINYSVKHVTIKSPGIRWDADTIPMHFSFSSNLGSGDIQGDFTINTKNNDYSLAALVHKFDLNIVGQYLKALSNYGSFKAILDADLKSKGNLIDRANVTNSGQFSVSSFHFGKDSTDDFAAFDNLTVAIRQLSPKKFKYLFDSISLKHPYLKYEKYDYLDNVQTMFGKNGSKVAAANAAGAKFNLVIEIAKYIKTLSSNLLRSNYQIDRLAIYEGDIIYNDYSLSEKFAIELKPYSFSADSIDKTHKRVDVISSSGIKPYGDYAIRISINPLDSSDFDLNYHFKNLPVSLFNPYLIQYTSFPMDRGTIEINGDWRVRNGAIKSDNHIVIIDPRIGEKSINRNANWLPLRFAMYFIRERGNVIDYEVPIAGNLKNPKFKLKDVILDALENIFVKPATTPYRIEVKTSETEIEKSLSLKWELRSSLLASKQKQFLSRMADFLKENPQANITVSPQHYLLKEKEYITLYEAKKKYILKCKGGSNQSYNEQDSLKVEKLSIKDTLFLNYLNARVVDSMLFTVQDKCLRLLGEAFVAEKLKSLNKERLRIFLIGFDQNGTEKRIVFLPSKNNIPYNGFSTYQIAYKGEFPSYLTRAYQKMNELNDQVPRKKYKKERQKLGNK
jgi:uncharacterized protein YdcH (DUF465 family)